MEIYLKFKGLDPVRFIVAAFLLAGIDDERDPAVIEHYKRLINAAKSEELVFTQKYKKVKKRRSRPPGRLPFVSGGPPVEPRDAYYFETVPDWANSTVFRHDVHLLYVSTDRDFYREGISPRLKNVEEDSQTKKTKRELQKEKTEERNKEFQKLMEQLAKDKKERGELISKKELSYEISQMPKYKGIDPNTIYRATKVTWD